ncbi:MAG: hypothetical protein GTO63_30080 [Anaerolineae bacterium]|nr:hypothetical protein [Anaerolineae bacterium]NIN98955.1 hypothetical protein [Anaerolineae bacterium]
MLRPLRGRLIVKRVGDPERPGLYQGIVQPATVFERPQKGIIIAVNGVDDLEEGDAVIYQPWSDSWLFPGLGGEPLATITPKVVEAKVLLDDKGEAVYMPFRDRILIKPIPLGSRTSSGLHIARVGEDADDAEIEENLRGVVLEVGPTADSVKAGDSIIMAPYGSGATLGEWGIGLVLIKEEDILGTITNGA